MPTGNVSLAHRIGLLRSLAIYYGQPWKLARMRSLYGRWVKANSLCFDIGAHVGNRSFVWRSLGGRVVALEPQPLFAKWMRWQFRASPQVTVLESAVGRADQQIELLVSARTPTVSSVSAEWVQTVSQTAGFQRVKWQQTVRVKQVTLDALIEQYGVPAFCKIDVEGHELDVLLGLSQPLPALSFEAIGAAKQAALDCIDRLDALGTYRYAATIAERNQLNDWRDAHQMREWISSLHDDAPSADIFAELQRS